MKVPYQSENQRKKGRERPSNAENHETRKQAEVTEDRRPIQEEGRSWHSEETDDDNLQEFAHRYKTDEECQ